MKKTKEAIEAEKKALKKAANQSEENRLKVEHIEHLEELTQKNHKNIVLNSILSGLWSLTALLNITNALTNNQSAIVPAFLNIICCVLYGTTARREYKEKKENEKVMNKIKREVLGYSK